MMNAATVWKIALQLADTQEITVPVGAEILCAREQHGEICIWFRCDPHEIEEVRHIAICSTGHPAPVAMDGRYIGSAQLHGGSLVFHVFERIGAHQ